MKLLCTPAIASALLLALAPLPARAQSANAVCSLFSEAARGLNVPVRQIYVRPGVTAVDFNPAEEVIRHVEASNPEKVSINFDADIDSGYATTMFLRPITGVSIPHLPSGPTTQLMVTTEDRSGRRKLYPLELVYQPNGTNCNIWAIYPDSQGLPLIELADRRRVPVEYVTMGLAVAARDGSMAYDNPLRQRVQNFLSLVQNGESVVAATQNAAVSLAVIQELAQRGYDAYTSGEVGALSGDVEGS